MAKTKVIRIKEKYKHKNSGKGNLIIPDYWEWLKNNYSGDRHHFYGSGRTGVRLDCFVVMISRSLHSDIHAGDIGVLGYIEREGEYNLIEQSMELFQEWITSEMRFEYQPLLDEILADMDNAIEIAKSFTP